MAIKSMKLAWVTVADIKKAEHFFANVLGLKVTSGDSKYNWLEFSGAEEGLYLGVGQAHPKDPSCVNPGQNAVMTMTVDDIVKEKTRLEAKGVKFLGDIMEVPGHVKLATFTDPDGNKYQLVQDLAKK